MTNAVPGGSGESTGQVARVLAEIQSMPPSPAVVAFKQAAAGAGQSDKASQQLQQAAATGGGEAAHALQQASTSGGGAPSHAVQQSAASSGGAPAAVQAPSGPDVHTQSAPADKGQHLNITM